METIWNDRKEGVHVESVDIQQGMRERSQQYERAGLIFRVWQKCLNIQTKYELYYSCSCSMNSSEDVHNSFHYFANSL